MNTPQTAILPEGMKACIVIEADFINHHDLNPIKAACKTSQELLLQCNQQNPSAHLGLTIAFGDRIWSQLRQENEGDNLKPFKPLGNNLAPATQHDLLIHIQSLNHESNLQLALSLWKLFKQHIKASDETHGFRLQQDRGLDGFVDGTENPKGEMRRLIGVDELHSGSYVLIQKYRHNLDQWNTYSEERQSEIIGRSKISNEELPKEQRLINSHLARVDLKENGKGLKIIRQSLPYGTVTGEHGLLFIAYCGELHSIEQQLLSMFGEVDGQCDLLLSHISTPISGSYYYAPSIERLCHL